MSGSRPAIFVLLLLVLTLAGCGAEEREQPESDEAAATATETSARPPEASEEESEEPGVKTADARAVALARRPPGEDGLRVPARRARIVAKESAFGRVLFDLNGQAVYVFERDPTNRSNCTSDECVEAWPPVLTEEQPSAGAGVEAGLLGTIRRSEGRLQVTYNGRPLYFYEHEGPGEIQCHNVDLHGGLWWVITPRGDPAD